MLFIPRIQKLTNGKETPPFLYTLARLLIYFVFRLGWRLEIFGQDNIPKEGAVICAANHRSYADPPLVGLAVPREVHFLAKHELFSFGPFGWLIYQLNGRPINRKSGASALKDMQTLLENGRSIVVFPEGKRIKTEEMGAPKAGIGLLANNTGVPIVPIYIHNSANMVAFKKLQVIIGKPLTYPESTSPQIIAANVLAEIQNIKNHFEKNP